MAERKTFFISTSIPYVNAAPHIGFALEVIQADIIARYRRIHEEDVFFLSGTDDNALKNVQAAETLGRNVADYVAENAQRFEDLCSALAISNDDFIKTSSDPRHKSGAQKLWSACRPEDIYKKTYRGLYCVGCEEFKTEKDLAGGECPEHPGKKLEEVEEENYFFKLSNYGEKLLKLIEGGELRIIPETRKNEAVAFIKGGLEDFSISRSKERARGWGVPVPGDESQIMYVWFDALSNYINALGYGEETERYKKYWVNGSERVHAIGKGINRFHTIYWPAMLLSAGVVPPTTVFIHGYITVGGQKMSKSIGNVIDPNDLIEEYGSEATRYLLARLPTFEDGDITPERLKETYNAHLANGIGNLVSRVMKMATTYLPSPVEITNETEPDPDVALNLERFEISRAVDRMWERIGHNDALIAIKKPFEGAKSENVSVRDEAVSVIKKLVRELYVIATEIEPIMPGLSSQIKEAVVSHKKPENLFPRKE